MRANVAMSFLLAAQKSGSFSKVANLTPSLDSSARTIVSHPPARSIQSQPNKPSRVDANQARNFFTQKPSPPVVSPTDVSSHMDLVENEEHISEYEEPATTAKPPMG